MIYCQNCGTANRDGSKFCNECGTSLAPQVEPLGEAKVPSVPVEQVAEGPPPPEEAGVPPTEVTETILPPAQENAGPLAGIQGVLPIEPIFATPHAAKAAMPAIEPAVGAKEAELFEEAITAVLPPAVEPTDVRREKILHWCIYAFIALAVIVPLVLPFRWFGSGSNPASAGTTEFYESIEALPSDSVVLMAYDYDPSTAAEMTLQAEAVVHHLMERDLRIVAVSLFPAGPGMAQEILDEAASEHGYQYGEDYINLGYLPDQPASLRAFVGRPIGGRDYGRGRAVLGFPIAQSVHRIQDIVLIIELAGGQDTLRWWVEQVGSPYSVPMVAGVTASLEPNARPYRNSGQLSGLLSGLPGAAEYERLNDRPGGATVSLDSQSLAHLAIVVLIVLGNLGYIITRARKKL